MLILFYHYSALNSDLNLLFKHGKNISLYENDCEKTLEKITEYLISKSDVEENFNLFCHYKIIEKIILLTKYHIKNINIIIIKNLGLLIPSVTHKKILYYFFSHDYMNQILLNISSSIEEQDIDFLSYYINFLKTLANKLDINTLSQLFHKENNSFPLLDEASSFFYFNDVMIKNTARNIFLSIIKLNYEPVIQYICDIPRVTDLLLLCDNIKSYIDYMMKININNNLEEIEQKLKEIEENLVDDILFIQDILSIDVYKINYVLINCLFSIPLQFLFNCILKHQKTNIAFYVLNLILKHVKNECINNLIFFVLYSSHIHENINAYIQKQEVEEIYNILYLNKLISHRSTCSNLIFEEFIILVYNQNFLKSIRYLKEEEKIFDEIKEIANYIKERNDDVNQDIYLGIKIISEMLEKNNKLTQTVKKMESYHNLISRYIGINVGISHFESNFSFLKIINENFLFYRNEIDLKNSFNINIQENIIKKELLKLIDNIEDNNQSNESDYINQIFFILQIMNSNKVSIELKKFLYLNINTYDSLDQNIILNDQIEKEINKPFYENKLLFRNIRIKNDLILNDSDSSISAKKRNDLIKDFFGISETKTDYDILNNYFTNTINEESNINNNSTNNNLMPRPFNSNIIDDIINFKMYNFNNKNLNKLFIKYNTKNIEDKNNPNLNLKFHDELLQKLFDIYFNSDKIRTKLNYRISLEFIENLIFGLDNAQIVLNKEKYNAIIIKKYKQILNEINNILLNSNSIKTKIYKFAYQYFEECFSLNKKKSNLIFNECIINNYLFLVLNISQKKDFFDIIDIPDKEHEKLQCLFQLIICLYDLIKLFNFDKNKEKDNITLYKNLLRNSEFPLRLIKNNDIGVDKKINIEELKVKVKPIPVIYKTQNSEFKNFFIFHYQNFLFVVTKSNKKEEINKSFFIIKYLIPLRQIIACADRGEPREIYLLNKNEIRATLLFDDVQNAINMKESINNAIKLTNLREFSEVKKYINDLIKIYFNIK